MNPDRRHETAEPEPAGMPLDASRWRLIRDVLAFQLKLFVDGVRDFVMMPVSLGAAVLDLIGVGPRPGHQFYRLLRFGRETDRWIDLFGAVEPDRLTGAAPIGLDALIERIERVVVQEYDRGGITSAAKRSVDRALDALQSGGADPP